METHFYIESLNQFPVADWGVFALLALKSKGANIHFYETIEEVPLNRNSIVIGSIEDVRWFFDQMGYKPLQSITMPEELIKYAGRKIEIMPYAEAFAKEDYPFFVKPYTINKGFQSGVVEKPLHKQIIEIETTGKYKIDKNQLVLVSEVVDFISEYRGYVLKGELIGLKHYNGDMRIFPDVTIIDKAISDFISQPIAYSIDFGVTSDGRTLLVECNSAFSLGCYQLESRLYLSMIINAWRENLNKNPIL